jgi:hypothetical protein
MGQQNGDTTFLILRPGGALARFDLAIIARDLKRALEEHAKQVDALPQVLLDWSGVTSWPYQPSSQKCVQLWKKTVPRISRAALIHNRTWDRQAALIAVLLRSKDSEVRSFLPIHGGNAIGWLVSGKDCFVDIRCPRVTRV